MLADLGSTSIADALDMVVMLLALAAIGVGALGGLRSLVRRHGNGRDLLVGGLLVVAAFLLRWLLPPHGPFHENHHGYDVLATTIAPTIPHHFGVGSSYRLLLWLVTSAGPGSDGQVFALNAIWSALAVGGAFALVLSTTKKLPMAFAAGVLLAAFPHAVRLGPTEVAFDMALGATLLAWPLLWGGIREGRPWQLVLGLALAITASTVRVLTMFLVVGHLAVIVAAVPSWRRPPWRRLLVTVGSLGVALVPHAVSILLAARGVETGTFVSPEKLALLFEASPGWSSRLVPASWVPLGLAGMLLLPFVVEEGRRWRAALLFVVVPLVLQAVAHLDYHLPHVEGQMRQQLVANSLLALPAGLLLGALALGPGRLRRVAWSLPLLVGAVGLVTSWDGLVAETAQNQEYEALLEQVQALPDDTVVLAPPDDFEYLHVPAAWLSKQRPTWSVATVRHPGASAVGERYGVAFGEGLTLVAVVDLSCHGCLEPLPLGHLEGVAPAVTARCVERWGGLTVSSASLTPVDDLPWLPHYPRLCTGSPEVGLLTVLP